MARRPRRTDEVCEYCYAERVLTVSGYITEKKKQKLVGLVCICATNLGCRSPNCMHGKTLGGTMR